jgi:antitoxin HicB
MALEYAVRIERLAESDGGGYFATVPDLPGCMSDAIASWIEAAKEWKMEIPEPSPPLARVG